MPASRQLKAKARRQSADDVAYSNAFYAQQAGQATQHRYRVYNRLTRRSLPEPMKLDEFVRYAGGDVRLFKLYPTQE